jgi:hypothetical protein
MYMHVETQINDNTIRTYSNAKSGLVNMLAVFISPKGIDGKVTTISGGSSEFTSIFGDGPFSVYGQPFLNAKAAASTDAAILQCIRVTAPDATYANRHIYVRYRVVPADDDAGTPASMEVMFIPKSTEGLTSTDQLLTKAPAVEKDLEGGWKEMRLLSVVSKGRGTYGNNYRMRISNNYRSDKVSAYKNYYYTLFENTTQLDSRRVCMYSDAIISGVNYYLESSINDVNTGSDDIIMDINEAALTTIYYEYKMNVDPDTTLTEQTFDMLLGINKNLASSTNYSSFSDVTNDVSGDAHIANYSIVSDADLGTIELNSVLGFALDGGSDGCFAVGAEGRDEAINDAYKRAFNGEIDRNIMSKYRCPIDVALDANYPIDVKIAMANLNDTRKEDHITYFDLGLDISSLSDPYSISEELDMYASHWTYSIDAYYGKIKDPYNLKIVEVTSTYNLAKKLPALWKTSGGKHIPYAGDYGEIDSYIKDSIYPVYDDSIDSKYLVKLKDAHLNYAQIEAKGRIIRANQDTRYPEIGTSLTVSNLTELNNCHVILDIKKDAEAIAAEFLYHFNETSDLATFNIRLDTLTSKYSAAQVKKISAKPSRTDEEAELGILHLYIEVVHKALVKIVQIDIDVNRGVDS